MDPRIVARFAGNHGVAERWRLVKDGVSEDSVDGLLQRGALQSLSWGVYGPPGAPMTPFREMVVAGARCGPGARLVGPRVLRVLGLRELPDDDIFAVLLRPGRRVQNVPWLCRTDLFPGRDKASLDGLPITTGTRQVIESLSFLPAPRQLPLLDQARWAGVTTTQKLQEWARRHPSHPGSKVLAGLLEDLRLESEGERRMQDLLVGFDVEWQVWVTPTRRVDALVRDAAVVVEYLGERVHGTSSGRAADEVRDAELEAAGFAVFGVTKHDLAVPDATRARLRTLVEMRRAAFRRYAS